MTRKEIHLRRARLDDRDAVFAWRNDPAARAASLDDRPLEADAHNVWFTRAVADPNRIFLIAEHLGAAVGLVRFDRMEDGAWRVSILINPQERGRGFGAPLLAHGTDYVREVAPHARFRAEIREGNVASERIFSRCGYQRLDAEEGVGRWALEPEVNVNERERA